MFGLSPATVAALQAVLFRHPEIEAAEVFGSRAKRCHRPGSDIDLALRGRDLDLGDLLQIEQHIDALDLPYQVDVALYALIENATLRERIDRVGRTLYQAPEHR